MYSKHFSVYVSNEFQVLQSPNYCFLEAGNSSLHRLCFPPANPTSREAVPSGDIVAWWIKLLPVALTSQMGAGLIFSCSTVHSCNDLKWHYFVFLPQISNLALAHILYTEEKERINLYYFWYCFFNFSVWLIMIRGCWWRQNRNELLILTYHHCCHFLRPWRTLGGRILSTMDRE